MRQFPRWLTVRDLGDNDAIVVTISKADIKSFSGDYLSGGDRKVCLMFEEIDNAELPLNARGFNALVQQYGNDKDNNFRAWLGKPCVLVKETTEFDNKTHEVVWVADAETWADAMKASGKKPATSARRRS